MDQVKRKTDFGTCLRQTWNTTMRVLAAMEPGPMEDTLHRVDRLEREMAKLKRKV